MIVVRARYGTLRGKDEVMEGVNDYLRHDQEVEAPWTWSDIAFHSGNFGKGGFS